VRGCDQAHICVISGVVNVSVGSSIDAHDRSHPRRPGEPGHRRTLSPTLRPIMLKNYVTQSCKGQHTLSANAVTPHKADSEPDHPIRWIASGTLD
jgi:hypothetical protein